MNSGNDAPGGLVERSRGAAQAQDKNDHAQAAQRQGSLLERSRAAHAPDGHARPAQERGHETEEAAVVKLPDETWVQFLARQRQESESQNGNEQARGRSLPDEQKQEQENSRGR